VTETTRIVTGVIVVAVIAALAVVKRRAHIGILIRFATKPIPLIPRQLAGGRWYVEATWADGRIQHVNAFKTQSDARSTMNQKRTLPALATGMSQASDCMLS
jgi:hypothetical protein